VIVYRTLLYRIVWAYLLLFAGRLVFFTFNYDYFSNYPFADVIQVFWNGMRFDTTTLVYTNGIIWLLTLWPGDWKFSKSAHRITLTLFVLMNSFILLLNLIDSGYFPFSGKRSGMEFWSIQGDSAGMIWVYIKSYWHLFIIWLSLTVAAAYFYPTLHDSTAGNKVREWSVLIIFAAVMGIGARGTLRLKPLNPADAIRYTHADLVPVALNTPFQMIFTWQQSSAEQVTYFDERIAEQYYSTLHTDTAAPRTNLRNYVLIVVESLSKEYVGFYNQGNGYTPFLDSLCAHSRVYQHAYANGKRSVEGLPAILASMPAWLDRDYMSSMYIANKLDGIAAYLTKKGYDASFYHGGKNGTMSFDNLIARTGGSYFGKNEYTGNSLTDDDDHWGIYDKPYMRYWLTELTKKREPFFSTLFTLSSHHPYELPAHEKNLYPEGELPIHKTIRYTDDALRLFFSEARMQPWFSNTVFILTADHTAESNSDYYRTSAGKYEIPLIVYYPGMEPETIDHTTQQIDIMPMVLNDAHIHPYFAFGKSDTLNRFAMQYADRMYQLIQWPYVYQFSNGKGLGFYRLTDDSLMQYNLLNKKYNLKQLYLDSLTKSIIQQYNKRLISNSTHIQ
jgi:phosphoglycerol transferase MdoB-like AlkP superfamily enzyme